MKEGVLRRRKDTGPSQSSAQHFHAPSVNCDIHLSTFMSKNRLFLIALALLIPSFTIAQTSDPIDIVIGQQFKIHSDILDQSRDIFIGLPDSYYQGSRSYPVIYVLDGYGHFTSTQVSAQSLARVHSMDEAIVVGVGQNNRNTELGTGQREEFRQFLTVELREWLAEKYRINDYALLIGHSLGGSFTWYQALKDPDAFDAMISISPVLKRENLPSVSEIELALPQIAESMKHVHMSVGSEHQSFREPIEELEKILDDGEYLKHGVTYYPEESHGSVPMPATYEAFKFIFEGWINPSIKDLFRLNSIKWLKGIGGMKMMERYATEYSEKMGYEVAVPDIIWSRFAWTYLNDGHREELIDLVENHGKGHEAVTNYLLSSLRSKTDFELAVNLARANLRHHPKSSNALFQLAQVLAAQNKREEAMSNAEMALISLETANPLRQKVIDLINELN